MSATTGMTAREGRHFGLTLAAGFGAVGALLWWRGHVRAAAVVGGVALLAAAAGLLVPTRLRPVERGWTALGVALSRVTTPVFYSIIYFVILTPSGLLRRTFGRSPLARDPSATSYWERRPAVTPEAARRAMEHQF